MKMGAADSPPREPGLHKLAIRWLCVLAPLFFATYGFATWVTSLHSEVSSRTFDWEQHVPFWAWTIVPYWSIDLLYAFSLFLPRSREALRCHALRLLTAQLIAVICFLAWPLRFSFARPGTDGAFGWLFEILSAFDKPFNQAPSLHIALLVVLWVCFAKHIQGTCRWLMHGWFALIGISVMTTYQHHFLDIPTGALLGWLCVWLWPDERPINFLQLRPTGQAKRLSLGFRYGGAALFLAGTAFWFGGASLWLIWPAISLGLVALNYMLFGAAGFQKSTAGRISYAAQWLLAPYWAAAWINSRLWTYNCPPANQVADDVWLGRIPTASELRRGSYKAVVDLCAELSLNAETVSYRSVPVLDLTVPSAKQCIEAAQSIEELRQHGPVLVCCALGYSRSATALAAWLLLTERVASVDEAVKKIQLARPRVVLHSAHREKLSTIACGDPLS
jgi:protein-tyrosine phosphatase